MGESEIAKTIVIAIWLIVPVVLAFTILDYRKKMGHKEIVEIIALKANHYVYWIEDVYEEMDRASQIQLLSEVIIEELDAMGYNTNPYFSCLEREIRAALIKKENYACRYKQEELVSAETTENYDI